MKTERRIRVWLPVMFVLAVGTVLMGMGCQALDSDPAPAAPVGSSGGTVPLTDPDNLPANVTIFDPLTNGQTVGTVVGEGTFSPEGYTVDSPYMSYIAYSTDIVPNILIEFDAKGYIPWENDGGIGDGKIVIIEVFDSPHNVSWQGGASWQVYNMFHFRKRGLYENQWHNKVDGIELKIGGPGGIEEYKSWEGTSPAGNPPSWDPNVTYHWVVRIENGEFEITRNGEVMFADDCPEYAPVRPINIRIGGVAYMGRSGSEDVTYSNVRISRL